MNLRSLRRLIQLTLADGELTRHELQFVMIAAKGRGLRGTDVAQMVREERGRDFWLGF